MKNLESFSKGIDVIYLTVSPIALDSEIAEQTEQVKVLKGHLIIDGPEFNSIGYGEGGVVREFDFSKLKKDKQIQILQWINQDTLKKFPNIRVIRKESMAGESFSVVAEETYTWNGNGFDKKVNFEE